MHMSIQRFMGNVFCGSLPRFDLSLQNELALFWHRTWEGGVGWCKCSCEEGFRTKQLHSPQRRLQDASDVVRFLKEGMSSQAPSTYEGSGSSITRHLWNVNLVDVDRSTLHLCDRIYTWFTKVAFHT